jgi:oxygen-independent coproporphyrinogen-3 oxidase
MGINRFSVGAQSFNDRLLKTCGRRHSAEDTRKTLRLLLEKDLKFSFDLLFALPGQTLEDLDEDLKEALAFQTRHMSLYCLTVPEGHPMSFGRAPEDEQLDMFDLIDRRLREKGLQKYEISNYAEPGFESFHNLTYWNDRPYWGLGLSAHSYFLEPSWGVRFWNPKGFKDYEAQLTGSPEASLPYEYLPSDQREHLSLTESLSDFCHMAFRQPSGLSKDAAQNKYGKIYAEEARPRLKSLVDKGWMRETESHWRLTLPGERLLNQVLLELSF